jgi:hypothetical protein
VVDLDLGGGLGDLLALTLAVRNPQVDVVGIVTPSSRGSERARILSKWLDLLDRPDIRIGEGGEASRPTGVPASWAPDRSNSAVLSATRVLVSAIEANGSSLQVLVWGPGSALTQALVEDRSLASGFRRVAWTQSSEASSPFATFAREGEVGPILFGASCTLIACEIDEGNGVALTREDWIALGKARSELTDEISALAASYRQETAATDSPVEIPHVLSVVAASGLPAGTPENKWVRKDAGGSIVFAAAGERKISFLHPISPESLKAYLFRELVDPSRDLGIHFAHFLKSLLTLDAETKEALKGKLDLTVKSEEQEKKSGREKMLDFLEYKLKVLRERPKPSVESTLKYLEASYLEYAGLGWWFPDEFYWDWRLRPSDPEGIRFGVANGQGLSLEQISASLRIGEVSQTQSVESATGTVRFKFDIPPHVGDSVSPASAELSFRFDCEGGPIERSRYLFFSP